MERTPFGPEVLEILQVMIAPGERMRLSPMVEEAQIKVLFKRDVDSRNRYDSIRTILLEHESDIQRLAEVQVESLKRGSERYGEEWYKREDFCRMWLVHNFPVNVCKVQMGLLELVKAQLLKGEIVVIDIGVGAGNAPIALFDFLLAWSNICMLFDLDFPIQNVQYVGYDNVQGWLDTTEKVLQAYQEVIQARIGRIAESSPAKHMLELVKNWLRNCELKTLDLNRCIPETPTMPTLLIACNLLSELKNEGKTNLNQLLAALPDNSCALIIEPGDHERAPALFRWRREFMRNHEKWSILAPCGQEYGRELPQCCESCWNLRRDSFHQTQLYKKFREEANKLRVDRRSWDEHENNLLSQSYTILAKIGTPVPQEPLRLSREGRNGRIIGKARYIGDYSRDGDDFLKLCPASTRNCQCLMLKRRPGTVLPRLTHGDIIELKCSKDYKEQNIQITLFMAEDVVEPVELVDTSGGCPRSGFLPAYSERTRAAIDELAYRFFGFEKMRDFQHDILSYVLCGKSILAIAATGGGKSECFILPALLLPGITVVVAPLKSLMQDQYEQRLSERYGFGDLATFINSDIPFHEREERLRRMEKGYYKIVYFTPEQLQRDYILAALKRAHQKVGIRYIALDEAHCISQWGHDFRPAYLNIVHRIQKAGIEPLPVRIALTATASPRVREDICRELRLNPQPTVDGGDLYVHSSNRPELNFIVKVCKDTEEKVDDMLHRLKALNHQQDAAIIFLPHTGGDPNEQEFSQRGQNFGRLSSRVTDFASYLERALKQYVCIYHSKIEDGDEKINDEESAEEAQKEYGDLRGRSRRKEQVRFIHGERHIMVATKGFGMGIDKPNIRLVMHRTPPANLEAYIQEAGRAGRDGRFADVVLYYSPDAPIAENEYKTNKQAKSDYEIQEFFIKEKYIRKEDVEAMCEFLKQVQRRVNNALYFTNDEVMEFLDKMGFQWPDFPPRESYGDESPEHKEILDRGYEYENKKKYIDKILSAMYSFRPEGHELLNRVQSVGIKIVNPQLFDPGGIIRSNAYFGELLRGKEVTEDELRQLILEADGDNGIIPLAERLGCSLYETNSMLWDIKLASGRKENNEWKPDLLDFKATVTPRYGPAAGKGSLQAWRAYAGALRKASRQKAEQRAEQCQPVLMQELMRRASLPRSEQATNLITRCVRMGNRLHAQIGKAVRDREIAFKVNLQDGELNGRIANELPNDAEILYFRDCIERKLSQEVQIQLKQLMGRKNFDDAQQLLEEHGISSFEAGFYRNPKIRIVALRAVNDVPELIVLTELPLPLDCWFDWDELPRSEGWEVELGDAFRSDEELNKAIEAFMQEHNQRQQDDWSAYEYLLNDYVGVNSQGKGNCLRAVMLGYLKTNEVVVGESCYSCSRCVEDENFSQDMELRRSVVQLLRQEIIDLLNEIDQKYIDKVIDEQKLNQLWNFVKSEQKRGRNVHPYLQGWSGRVLTDVPEHKTVHLLRLDAMRQGYWSFTIDEYIYHLRRLLSTCSVDELQRIEPWFEHIRQFSEENLDVIQLLVEFYRKLQRYSDELSALNMLVDRRPSYANLERILQLYDVLQIHDIEKRVEIQRLCARYAPDAEHAVNHYGQTPIASNHHQVFEECIHLLDGQYPQKEAKALRLMAYCLDKLDKDAERHPEELLDLGNRWAQIRENYRLGEKPEAGHLDRAVREKIADLLAKRIEEFDTEQLLQGLHLVDQWEVPDQLARMLDIAVLRPDEKIRMFACEKAEHFGDRGIGWLERIIKDEQESLRKQGYATLTKIRSPHALQLLEHGLNDPSEDVRLQVVEFLSQLGRLDGVATALRDDSVQVRERAYEYIIQSRSSEREKYLVQALLVNDENIQQRALVELISHGGDDALIEAIASPDFRFAREALLYLGYKRHIRGVEQALKNPNASVRKLACWLAIRLQPDRNHIASVLEQLAHDSDDSVRRFACLCAVRLGIMSVLKTCLGDKNARIRCIAVKGVARAGSPDDRLTRISFLNTVRSYYSRLKDMLRKIF